MASGGARVRSGPAPDPHALRRDREAGQWVTLPAEGRTGPTPEWPLTDPTARELELWQQLWRKPQALLWERNGQHHEVAMYCRRFAAAEVPDAPVALGTLVRQMMDSLLLTIPAMRSARVQIAGGEGKAEAESKPARRRGGGSRARLTVVRGDGDEAGD